MCRYGAVLVVVLGIVLLPFILALGSYNFFDGHPGIIIAKTIVYRILITTGILLTAIAFQEAMVGAARRPPEGCWFYSALFMLIVLTAATALTARVTDGSAFHGNGHVHGDWHSEDLFSTVAAERPPTH